MLFSIVVPTCNRNDLLAICLEALSPGNQSIDAAQYEVIVTDDGKNGEAKDLVEQKFGWAKWIKGPRRGPAANRNNGARQTTGDWIVFIDDDCIPDKNIIAEFYKHIQLNPHVKAFEGAILPDDWNKLSAQLSECPINTNGGCFWSANICVEKALFNSIGGFDEQFMIAAQEDQDIYIRLGKCTPIAFIQNAFVIHPVRIRKLSDKIKSIPKSLKNWIYFCSKHSSFKKMIADGFNSQFAALKESTSKKRPKLALYHVLIIIQLLPAIAIYYKGFSKKEIHANK
jgi:GT2 family glycosyltransferase